MSRWIRFLISAVFGVALLVCGLLVPAHLRAVDSAVLERISAGSSGLAGRLSVLLTENRLGAAQMLAAAAGRVGLPGAPKLQAAVMNQSQLHADLNYWGGPKPVMGFLASPELSVTNTEPFADFLIRTKNRQKAIDLLAASRNPGVEQLLRLRTLTNTTLFPPVRSASGQALDAAISLAGLLMEERGFSPALSNAIIASATQANRGTGSLDIEQPLMNLLSLGQRLNWGQLKEFLSTIPDPETLRQLAHMARTAEDQLPILFSAVEMSGNSAGVARYLAGFSGDGLHDLGIALQYGPGGVNELLSRNKRLSVSRLRPSLLADWSLRRPVFGLTVKWLFYLSAGFLLAMAAHFARRTPSELERPLRVRGVHFAREGLFALGFLLVVLLISEPFLAYHSQQMQFPSKFRLRTPTELVAAVSGNNGKIMNHEVLLTMLLFFVLQALLYVACLVKLAEIKRQRVPARMKLRLIDNEDHLFDAGLYLGFVGTIVSLVLVSMGVFKQPSLMAAYSSTSFGIIFVSLFKIAHLRGARRRLLLDAEAADSGATHAPGVSVRL